MPVYTPPALNAVDFALTVQPSHSVAPYVMVLTSYTVPALNAIDFDLSVYTQPVYNTIDFELLGGGGGGTNWTLNLSDTVTLSEAIIKEIVLVKADTVTLSENITKSIGKDISDVVILSEDITKHTGKLFSDNITLSESLAKRVDLVKLDTVTLSDEALLDLLTGGSGPQNGSPQEPVNINYSGSRADRQRQTDSELIAIVELTLKHFII